jgi:hypothetical protein
MNTDIQPPRALPLRVVGWLSLPWRHWIYIGGTLLFGLFFVTVAPVSFLVRLLVLVVPFLISLGLAIPYGGLHMDEWLALAFRYALRPSAAMTNRRELKGPEPGELEALLEAIEDDAPPQSPEQQTAAPPMRTHGLLRRSYQAAQGIGQAPIFSGDTGAGTTSQTAGAPWPTTPSGLPGQPLGK